MENVSILTHALIVLSTVTVIYLLYMALRQYRGFLLLVVIWSIIIGALGLTDFYREINAVPPRFLFLVAPGILLALLTFLTVKGRKIIDSIDLGNLTLLHVVRLPVEIVLYHLYAAALVPKIMTFEGSNFDIVTGLTAPLIYYQYFRSQSLGAKWLLAWNLLGLFFLLTIMFIAVLSSPTSFQQFGFEQPNTGVTYFPFVWLPGIIVPVAFFAHLASIRQLLATPYTNFSRFYSR